MKCIITVWKYERGGGNDDYFLLLGTKYKLNYFVNLSGENIYIVLILV